MKLIQDIKKLCTPAYVYLVISALGLVLMMIQNAGNTDKYCVGEFECEVGSTAMIFLAKGLYVAFWTFVLNAICKSGYKNVSWFLVLLPFILLAIVIGMFMLSSVSSEAMTPRSIDHPQERHL